MGNQEKLQYADFITINRSFNQQIEVNCRDKREICSPGRGIKPARISSYLSRRPMRRKTNTP